MNNANDIRSFGQLIRSRAMIVPIIQRDYAQGRQDRKTDAIRGNFIRDILAVLDGQGQTMNLHYIYGARRSDGKLLLIDGQQRTTTLYLVAWFCAASTLDKVDFDANFVQRVQPLSYEVRRSSIRFFQELYRPGHQDDFKEYAADPKVRLTNFPWFKAQWLEDPTIEGAVRFLDDLKLDGTGALRGGDWQARLERLLDPQDCPIRLVLVELEDSTGGGEAFAVENQAARTYINMNAKGKLLTPFENFKAMMDQDGLAKERFVSPYDRGEQEGGVFRNPWVDTFYQMAVDLEDGNASLSVLARQMDQLTMGVLTGAWMDLGQGTQSGEDAEQKIRELCCGASGGPWPERYFDWIAYIVHRYRKADQGEAELKKRLRDYCGRGAQRPERWSFLLREWYPFLTTGSGGQADPYWQTLSDDLHIGEPSWSYEPGWKYLRGLLASLEDLGNLRSSLTKAGPDDTADRLQKAIGFRDRDCLSWAALKEAGLKAGLSLELEQADPLGLAPGLQGAQDRHHRELRYLFYLSGFWRQGDTPDRDALSRYLELDRLFFDQSADQDTRNLWCRLFYLSALGRQVGDSWELPKGGWTLPAADAITWLSRKELETCLSWTGRDGAAGGPPTQLLMRIKAIFDLGTRQDMEAYLDQVSGPLDRSCWLYYLLERSYQQEEVRADLFRNDITEQNGAYQRNGTDFYAHVLGLDYRDRGYEYRETIYEYRRSWDICTVVNPSGQGNKRNLQAELGVDIRFVNLDQDFCFRITEDAAGCKRGRFFAFRPTGFNDKGEDLFALVEDSGLDDLLQSWEGKAQALKAALEQALAHPTAGQKLKERLAFDSELINIRELTDLLDAQLGQNRWTVSRYRSTLCIRVSETLDLQAAASAPGTVLTHSQIQKDIP